MMKEEMHRFKRKSQTKRVSSTPSLEKHRQWLKPIGVYFAGLSVSFKSERQYVCKKKSLSFCSREHIFKHIQVTDNDDEK
jgi:hypothetical protein